MKEAAKDALNERQQIKSDMNEISIEINTFGEKVSEIKNNIGYLNISVINGEIQDSKQVLWLNKEITVIEKIN